MLDPQFEDAAADWLNLTGELVTYRSPDSGYAMKIMATLERHESTVDELGMTTPSRVLTVLSSDVSPVRGDVVTMSNGDGYKVDELFDDTGTLTRLFVSTL